MVRDSQNTAKIGIFVPNVFIFCAFCVNVYDVRLHVDFTLLNMEMFLDTQILQKFQK